MTWEYVSVWFHAFHGDSSLYILTAHRDGELTGILPLRAIKCRKFGISGLKLAFIGDDYAGADHLDMIVKEGDRAEVAAAFSRFLISEAKTIDGISLNNLTRDSPLRKHFVSAAGEVRWRTSERSGFICPQIDLERGWNAVLDGSRRATNFKRRLKQLERSGGLSYRSISAPGELSDAFERFLDLHKRRWGNDVSAVSGHPALVSFHRQLVSEMANTGLLRFDELWVNGECVASVYGFDSAGTYYYYNAGYDPEWASSSVGLVLTGLSIKAACERGQRRFDFLRGEEAYKFDWANGSENLADILFVRNSLVGRAIAVSDDLERRIRTISHSILPAALKDRVREWRFRARSPQTKAVAEV